MQNESSKAAGSADGIVYAPGEKPIFRAGDGLGNGLPVCALSPGDTGRNLDGGHDK